MWGRLVDWWMEIWRAPFFLTEHISWGFLTVLVVFLRSSFGIVGSGVVKARSEFWE
jgi:hypothetical protein